MFPFDFIFDFFGSLHAIIFGFKAMKYIYNEKICLLPANFLVQWKCVKLTN